MITYLCLVEERCQHEAKHNGGKTIQDEQKKQEEEVGLLEDLGKWQQDDAGHCQKQHIRSIHTEP